MSSLSARGRSGSRLAQQAQWRIAASQPRALSVAARATCRYQQVTSQRQPAALQTPPCSHAFSTSPRPFLDQRTRPTTASIGPQTQQPDPDHPPRRTGPGWTAAAIFLLVGVTTGAIVKRALSPPPPILPGTELDDVRTAQIRAAVAQLPLVKHLLSDPDWSGSHHEAYEGIPPEARAQRITTGPLAGTRGVGAYQHIFHNRSTGEVLDVVYLGRGTTGWPGVVHGGAIATLLDEHSARAALKDLGSGGGGVLTANLDITYKQPVLASGVYVLRARTVPEEELPTGERGKRGRKVWVDASIETVEGRTCVRCRSLFVAPKSMSLRRVPENF